MLSHATVMERQPPQKETANKTNLTSKIRKCSHWVGDLISCYRYCYMGFLDIVGLKYNPGIAYVNIFNDGKFNSSI
jgi:hypothetical protein